MRGPRSGPQVICLPVLREPVPGAEVTLSGPVNGSATTDEGGGANFEDLPGGTRQLSVVKSGFKDVRKTYELREPLATWVHMERN